MTNCIERLAEIYSNNNDKRISDEERGDSVEDRYDGCCGLAGWSECILILEGERRRRFEKSWIEEGADYGFFQQAWLGLE